MNFISEVYRSVPYKGIWFAICSSELNVQFNLTKICYKTNVTEIIAKKIINTVYRQSCHIFKMSYICILLKMYFFFF